jgi:hypothetical protein
VWPPGVEIFRAGSPIESWGPGFLMRSRQILVGLAVLLAMGLHLPLGEAQPIPALDETLLSFEYRLSHTFQDVGYSGAAKLPQDAVYTMTVKDTSVEQQDPTGQGGKQQNPLGQHQFAINLFWPGDVQPAGWSADVNPAIAFADAGEEFVITVTLKHLTSIRQPFAEIVLNVTQTFPARGSSTKPFSAEVTFGARVASEPGVQANPASGFVPTLEAAPGQVVSIPFEVMNADFYPLQVDVRAVLVSDTIDTSRMVVVGPGRYTLDPLETRIFNITFKISQSNFWYYQESLRVEFSAQVVGEPGSARTATHVMQVNGFSFKSTMFLGLVLLAIVVLVAILFLVIGVRHYRQAVMGKPIPPWKIPEEAEALEVLRVEDPRRFYILRHFLMEEEYISALAWFHTYKKRGKRQLKHARNVSRYEEKAEKLQAASDAPFDAKAERLRMRADRRRERRKRWLERKISRLEAKLEANHEADYEKRHEAWKAQVDKLTAKANKPILKERRKWEKERDLAIDKWETDVAKLQEQHEKAVAAIQADYEKNVRKQDKDAYKAWKDATTEADAENKVRAAEGKEPLPLPVLTSNVVEAPEFPEPPAIPAKPRAGKEPKLIEPDGLPPEPTRGEPKLEESSYARKAKRRRKKATRKLKKIEKKLSKKLAKNERKRAVFLADVERKRAKYERKSKEAMRPTLFEKVFGLTPEAHERRIQKRLLAAQQEDALERMEEAEQAKIERVRAELTRASAEFEMKLIRKRAEVRKAAAHAGKRAPTDEDLAPVTAMEQELQALRQSHQERLEKMAQEAKQKVVKRAQGLVEKQDSGLPEATGSTPKKTKGTTGSPSGGRKARPPKSE